MFFRLSMLKPLSMDTVSSFLASRGVPHVAVAAEVIPDTIDVDGKQRPTRNSKGRLIHPTLEGIRNFWKWFGDSKVVDTDGKPVVFYHYSKTSGFDVFTSGTDNFGMHFGTSGQAEERRLELLDTKQISELSGSVYPVYLNIKNPARMEDYGSWEGRKLRSSYLSHLRNIGSSVTESSTEPRKIIEMLHSTGYDAVIYSNSRELEGQRTLFNRAVSIANKPEYADEFKQIQKRIKDIRSYPKDSYIVFSPNQIKSAIGNNGDFNPARNEITATVNSEPSTIDVDGKQRPTKNSLGRPIHTTEEGIRNFWRWFGGSKVVDTDGNPLVVYHGTGKDFSAFDDKKTGSNDLGLWGRGHYFSSVVGSANSYALRQDNSHIIPAYVAIKNPLILTTGKDLIIRMPDGTNTKDLVGPNLDGSKIKAIALGNGHDGVIQLKTDGMIGDLVAYKSTQIKSAIGNRGTFDPREATVTASEEIPETILVGRKQRPTKTATGKLISPTLEGIQNFWKWFGDSKFVDASGHPRIAYHGTNSDFSIFDKKKIGSGPSKFGFWFADDPKFVDIFGSTLMPSFLRMLNPKKISHDKWNDIRERHAKDSAWFHAWREQIVAQGHDALWIVSSDEQIGKFSVRNPDIIAVIEPTQIKSALGNKGTFSPTDSEITASA